VARAARRASDGQRAARLRWRVAAAGYNTVQETQVAALPTLLWPFARDVDDQFARVACSNRKAAPSPSTRRIPSRLALAKSSKSTRRRG
jgi:hypothetical protein